MAGGGTSGDLPDVNVWLALVNEAHPHHAPAVAYWRHAAQSRIAFCRITALGLLRLTTNKAVMGGEPYTVAEAWQAYQNIFKAPEVSFLHEPNKIDASLYAFMQPSTPQTPDWTDAYLAAFASASNLRVVTFDRGFSQYERLSLLTLRGA